MNHLNISQSINQLKFENDFHKALINIIYTANYLQILHNTVFKEYDIQSRHYNVMRILKGKYPDAVQPCYILDVMLDKGCDLTRLIDKLQKRGYARRDLNPVNKRNVNITITQAGLDVLAELKSKIHQIDQEYHGNLTEEEFKLLSNLLDKMRNEQTKI